MSSKIFDFSPFVKRCHTLGQREYNIEIFFLFIRIKMFRHDYVLLQVCLRMFEINKLQLLFCKLSIFVFA